MISSDTVIYPAPQQQYFTPRPFIDRISSNGNLCCFSRKRPVERNLNSSHTASLITCGELKPSAHCLIRACLHVTTIGWVSNKQGKKDPRIPLQRQYFHRIAHSRSFPMRIFTANNLVCYARSLHCLDFAAIFIPRLLG